MKLFATHDEPDAVSAWDDIVIVHAESLEAARLALQEQGFYGYEIGLLREVTGPFVLVRPGADSYRGG